MPDSAEYKWFLPSEHGDQSPDALIANRTMNRIDIALLAMVVVCTIWNFLGIREVRSGGTGLPTLATTDDFFLRTSTIALWSVVAITAAWLITRYLLTRETRFVLVWEGTILAIAVLMPLITMELAGFSLYGEAGELRLSAYECPGSPPAPDTPPNLSECSGYPIDSGIFRLAGEHPAAVTRSESRNPNEISMNTARWTGLPGGTYVLYLLVDTPGAGCVAGKPGVVAIDAAPEIECLDSGDTVVVLEHPEDTPNLRMAVYPDGAD
jgi:hypothetical protein